MNYMRLIHQHVYIMAIIYQRGLFSLISPFLSFQNCKHRALTKKNIRDVFSLIQYCRLINADAFITKKFTFLSLSNHGSHTTASISFVFLYSWRQCSLSMYVIFAGWTTKPRLKTLNSYQSAIEFHTDKLIKWHSDDHRWSQVCDGWRTSTSLNK